MAFEDKTLACVQCGTEFVFSAGEQEFFEERGLNSPPKRCKVCRQENKKKKRRPPGPGQGEYRSPAFDNSAPAHQRMRSGGRGQRPGGQRNRDYRSPSFRDKQIDPQAEYRSPGFQEFDGMNPDEEYRAPGFKEYEGINPAEEYRAPGFSEVTNAWRDQKPEFQIICVACGKEAMVPFLPEEREDPMCSECYREHKEMMRREAAELEEARSDEEPTGDETTVDAPGDSEKVESEEI